MRYIMILAGLSVPALLLAADATIVEEIVCRVNGDIITRKDLEKDRLQLADAGRQRGLSGSKLEEFVTGEIPNLLRNRIDDQLLIQKAKQLDIKVDPDVNKEIARLQRETKISDPDKFQALVRQETGKSYEDYRSDLKNEFLKRAVVREDVMRRIQFKTEELKAYYDQHLDQYQRDERVFLRLILVSTQGKENDPVAMAAAQKKATDLAERARKGERFPELAQANSDDVTAKDGGQLEPAVRGFLDPELEAAVWDKSKNYVTDPIKKPAGWLILKVDEHHQKGLADFEEVLPYIQDRLTNERLETALRAYVTKLRQDAFLEIKAGYEDSGAAPSKNTTWTDPKALKPETITKEEVIEKGSRRKLLGVIPLPSTTHTGTSSSH